MFLHGHPGSAATNDSTQTNVRLILAKKQRNGPLGQNDAPELSDSACTAVGPWELDMRSRATKAHLDRTETARERFGEPRVMSRHPLIALGQRERRHDPISACIADRKLSNERRALENTLVVDHDIMHNDAMRRQSRNGKSSLNQMMDVFIQPEGDSIHEDMSQKSQLRTTEQVAAYFGVKPTDDSAHGWRRAGWRRKKMHRAEGVSLVVLVNVFDDKQVDRLMQARANAKMQVIPADTTHSMVAPANKMDRGEMVKML
jgi:hypothetical protein